MKNQRSLAVPTGEAKIKNLKSMVKCQWSRVQREAFTLIEMLLVVTLIAILAGIVIVAINPAKQLAESRNTLRITNLNTIADAVYQYSIDKKGVFPGNITGTPGEICKTGATSCAGFINLSSLTDKRTYLVAIPADPLVTQGNGTGYMISLDEGRVSLSAPYAERGQIINLIK